MDQLVSVKCLANSTNSEVSDSLDTLGKYLEVVWSTISLTHPALPHMVAHTPHTSNTTLNLQPAGQMWVCDMYSVLRSSLIYRLWELFVGQPVATAQDPVCDKSHSRCRTAVKLLGSSAWWNSISDFPLSLSLLSLTTFLSNAHTGSKSHATWDGGAGTLSSLQFNLQGSVKASTDNTVQSFLDWSS